MTYTWSYSSLGLFQQCPKKYYHLRVAKDYKEPETDALMYGKQLHEAAELYISRGDPIPPKFAFIKNMLDLLKTLGEGGEFLCEYRMALTRDLEPCDFFAKDVWWRGIADLLIVNEKKQQAWLVDYKTSKNAKYADTKQLDLLAGAVFTHFPKVVNIKSALLFVVSNEMVKKEHEYIMKSSYLNCMEPELTRLEGAMQNNVWNPNAGPLCKFCPVTECAHNRS